MNKFSRAALIAALMLASVEALAGKPVSITFESEGSATDGKPYALYSVKCSSGDSRPLTAWDNRKKWCVGKASEESCSAKQIRAAKDACQG